MFDLKDGTQGVGRGEKEEPLIDVFFDDVIENGNSTFVGCEVLTKDGYANGSMLGADVGEDIIEVAAVV